MNLTGREKWLSRTPRLPPPPSIRKSSQVGNSERGLGNPFEVEEENDPLTSELHFFRSGFRPLDWLGQGMPADENIQHGRCQGKFQSNSGELEIDVK